MCMGRFRRWYYDAAEEECKEFFFRGCSGNGNNFESKEQCERLCGHRYGKDSWQLPDENPFNGLESSSLIRLEEGQEYKPPGYACHAYTVRSERWLSLTEIIFRMQNQVSEIDCQAPFNECHNWRLNGAAFRMMIGPVSSVLGFGKLDSYLNQEVLY